MRSTPGCAARGPPPQQRPEPNRTRGCALRRPLKPGSPTASTSQQRDPSAHRRAPVFPRALRIRPVLPARAAAGSEKRPGIPALLPKPPHAAAPRGVPDAALKDPPCRQALGAVLKQPHSATRARAARPGPLPNGPGAGREAGTAARRAPTPQNPAFLPAPAGAAKHRAGTDRAEPLPRCPQTPHRAPRTSALTHPPVRAALRRSGRRPQRLT